MTIEETSVTALATLVGEGKKFKTEEDLAVGKLEADRFIVQLQTETATLREELQKATSKADTTSALERLMTDLTKPNTTNTTQQTAEEIAAAKSNHPPVGLSQDDVVKLIEARDAARVQTQNLATAMAQVTKVYGDKSKEFLEAKARDLGLSVEQLETLAKTSPQAFINVVGASTKDNSTRSMSGSSVNTDGTLIDTSSQVRNKTHYDKMMKEMGSHKFVQDRKIQLQMYKDMEALGDNFFQ